MAERFYTPGSIPLGDFVLAGADAHHLATVRRFEPGDRVVLFNGDGHEYTAEVVAVEKKRVLLTVLDRMMVNRESPMPVVVGSALPKGDRADYLIEKLVEVGATRLVPLITSRSVVKPTESKADKLARAVIEASKQCGRNVLMAVDPPTLISDFLALADLPARKFILHTSGEIRQELGQAPASGVAFAIGPEGGFTSDEVAAAIVKGWQPLSLGPRVLRVETATVVAAAWASTHI